MNLDCTRKGKSIAQGIERFGQESWEFLLDTLVARIAAQVELNAQNLKSI